MTSSNCLPKSPISKYNHTLRVRVSTYEFEGHNLVHNTSIRALISMYYNVLFSCLSPPLASEFLRKTRSLWILMSVKTGPGFVKPKAYKMWWACTKEGIKTWVLSDLRKGPCKWRALELQFHSLTVLLPLDSTIKSFIGSYKDHWAGAHSNFSPDFGQIISLSTPQCLCMCKMNLEYLPWGCFEDVIK